jgi:hypothetical protein
MLRPLSDDEKAENWRVVRKALRRYIIALMVPALALLWAAGYAKGLLDGAAQPAAPATRNEGNPK